MSNLKNTIGTGCAIFVIVVIVLATIGHAMSASARTPQWVIDVQDILSQQKQDYMVHESEKINAEAKMRGASCKAIAIRTVLCEYGDKAICEELAAARKNIESAYSKSYESVCGNSDPDLM